MVSIHTVVFPVCLSPITNSLWPLPIGIIASIDLIPVWRGSLTGCLYITPGAFLSNGISYILPSIFPLPSIGCPNVFTTLPTTPSPTLIEAILFVLFTVSPSFISLDGPNKTTPTLSSSRFNTIPSIPLSNCTNSPYWTFERP